MQQISARNSVILLSILIYLCVYLYTQYTQQSAKWENILLHDPNAQVKITTRITRPAYQSISKDIFVIDNLRIATEEFSHIGIGDKVQVTGRLDKRVIGKNTNQYWLMDPQIEVISSASDASLLSAHFWLYRINILSQAVQKSLQLSLPQPHASLLSGIVLGVRESMPKDYYNLLINSGTLHVIAASGFNITIIAKVLINSLSTFMSRKKALVLAFVGIIIYTVLAGMSEAVVRAAIMGSLAYTAQAMGRAYTAKWSLVLTSIVMLLIKPSLLGSVSFQLSVSATAGIIWLEPLISGYLIRLGRGIRTSTVLTRIPSNINQKIKHLITSDLSTTLAATIAVLPITAVTFERLSLVSPLANVMVLWLVPPAMFLGGIMAVAGLFVLPLARLVGLITWPLLELFIRITSWWGSLPFASLETPGLSWHFAAGYYLLLVVFVVRHKSPTLQG